MQLPDTRFARVGVVLLTHSVYFVGTTVLAYIALLFLCLRLGILHFGNRYTYGYEETLLGSWQAHRPLFIVALAIGLISGIFGPFVYAAKTMRGRGTLVDVRRHSRFTVAPYNQGNSIDMDDEERNM